MRNISENDFYVCRLICNDRLLKTNITRNGLQNSINEVRNYCKYGPFSLFMIFQDHQQIKVGTTGGALTWTKEDILDGYAFLCCQKGLSVQGGLCEIAKDLQGCLRVIRNSNGRYSKLSDVEKINIEKMNNLFSKEIVYEQDVFRRNDMVKMLKGRYLGYTGFVVTNENRYYRSRRLEKINVDGIMFDMPRTYIKKI